jgi:hypothetical protein
LEFNWRYSISWKIENYEEYELIGSKRKGIRGIVHRRGLKGA